MTNMTTDEAMSQITTHILDTSCGQPASGVPVKLSGFSGNGWSVLGEGLTDNDGRVADLIPPGPLPGGQYKLYFDTQTYFDQRGLEGFYPFVEIVFSISGDGQHYHVPLLLNPFGYSTYRGS